MSRLRVRQAALVAALSCLFVSAADAGRDSRLQSPARPLGLEIIAPVQQRNSDRQARQFVRDHWQGIRDLEAAGLATAVKSAAATSLLLDLNRISILNDYRARAYFVADDGAYHNSFSVNPASQGAAQGAELIFPDASAPSSGKTSLKEPLTSFDFVELGMLAGGTSLDFFLIADGANGGANVFSLAPSANPDGLRHIAIHARTDVNSPYLLLGIEDALGGGDGDFNDVVIALDIGAANVQHLIQTVGAPEPGSMATLGALLGIAWRQRRRMAGRAAPRERFVAP